jgi:hypothetical protein
MQYIDCGALDAATMKRITRKKRLKELAAREPAQLLFDPTSIYHKEGPIRGDAIPPDVTLSVCGPDPYTNRRWWAQVTLVDGKLRVT